MKKTMEEIKAVMKELAEFTTLQNELNAQIDALKDELKAYMKAENLEELLGDNGEHAVWRAVVGNPFDSTAFKKSEYGKLHEQFVKPTETKPFKFYA